MTFTRRPRAFLNATLFLGMVLGLLGPYVIMLTLWPTWRHRIAALFFKGCLKLTGIHLVVNGSPAAHTALFAVNHVSYLDIPVLGAVLSDVVFVAKSEVARWPLFGFLARLASTEFVARNRADAHMQCLALAQRLNAGDALIVFPEGTSSNGLEVRPFKSALFAALDLSYGAGQVQPVSIVYEQSAAAWFGDMTLAPHLWRMFNEGGGRVTMIFHEPVFRADFPDRKALAQYCEGVVRDAIDAERFNPEIPAETPAQIPPQTPPAIAAE